MNLKLRIERPLAATILFGVLLLFAGLVLAALVAGLSSAIAERDAKAEFVARAQRGPHPAQSNPGQGAAQHLALVAESESLAAAELETLIRSKFVSAGGAVMSSRTEAKHDETGPSGRIEVQALVDGSIESLQKALFELETETPVVLVDELSMQPLEASGTAGVDPQAPVLHATVTMSGYWLAGHAITMTSDRTDPK